jgi:hypothetical protein
MRERLCRIALAASSGRDEHGVISGRAACQVPGDLVAEAGQLAFGTGECPDSYLSRIACPFIGAGHKVCLASMWDDERCASHRADR